MKIHTQIGILLVGATLATSSVFAESDSLKNMMRDVLASTPQEIMQKIRERGGEERKSQTPQLLEVNGQGQVRLRGIVTSVSAGTISVKTWAGTWTVLPGVSPEVITKDKTINSIAVGDYVGVQGSIVPEAVLTVQGNVIRNRSWKEDYTVPSIPKVPGDIREVNPQNTISPKKLVPTVSNMPTLKPENNTTQTNDDPKEINPQNTFSPKKPPSGGPSVGGSGIMVEGSKPPVAETGTPGVIIIPLNY